MLDVEGIRQRLPHRYPFLLIDRVVEKEEGRVVALKNVTVNEPFFQGHFPEPFEAVMPGVLIVEAMAQTAAFLVLPDGEDVPLEGYLVGIDKARFRKKVVPGDQLRIEAEKVREKRGLLQARVEVTVEGEPVASASISLVLLEGDPQEPQ
ncbi:3-hydroxyacyl-ACP dehydratase FabZ [Candidatus Bipolaricaulota bacterium]